MLIQSGKLWSRSSSGLEELSLVSTAGPHPPLQFLLTIALEETQPQNLWIRDTKDFLLGYRSLPFEDDMTGFYVLIFLASVRIDSSGTKYQTLQSPNG